MDMTNTNQPVSEIEEIAKQSHRKWLSKAKTAVIDGSELTVLPYGYLSQAVEEAIQYNIARIIKNRQTLFELKNNVKKSMEKVSGHNQIFGIENRKELVNNLKYLIAYIDGFEEASKQTK